MVYIIRSLLVQIPFSGHLKCPERSEPLGFGHPRVFLIFPFIYAAFRAPLFSMGIGHKKKKFKIEKSKEKALRPEPPGPILKMC